MIKKPELLAPAGSLEKLKWAIDYGADAVYLGGTNYSLRANAKNFTLEEMEKGVKYAHSNNAKVYVTVNIVFHDEDVINLGSYLTSLQNIGVDAIIFEDYAKGVLSHDLVQTLVNAARANGQLCVVRDLADVWTLEKSAVFQYQKILLRLAYL